MAQEGAQAVDLTLAVNYIPACLCLGKVLVALGVISLISNIPSMEASLYILVTFVLYIDRVTSKERIFDANSILLTINFANIFNLVRMIGNRNESVTTITVLSIFWITACMAMITESPRMKVFFEKRHAFHRTVPSLVMVFALLPLLFTTMPWEGWVVRTWRGVSFSILCIAWVYIMGVHVPPSLDRLSDQSNQYISRFSPVLYIPIWLAILFALASAVALVYHYMSFFNQADQDPEAQAHKPTSKQGGFMPPLDPLKSDEEMLKIAKLGFKLLSIDE
jgi:hypothetical protein